MPIVVRLRGEMVGRDRRMQAWHCDRGAAEARARFTEQWATRSMIGVVKNAMNAVATDLDEAMEEIVGARERFRC